MTKPLIHHLFKKPFHTSCLHQFPRRATYKSEYVNERPVVNVQSKTPPPPLTPSSPRITKHGAFERELLDSLPKPNRPVKNFAPKGRPFVDYRLIKITSGKGGDGCIAFLRDNRISHGRPNGGNGGKGGNVWIEASDDDTSLNGLLRTYNASSGQHGTGSDRFGGNGDDLVIKVPVGTVVRKVLPIVTELNGLKNEVEETKELLKADRVEFLRKWFKFPGKYVPWEDRQDMLMARLPKEVLDLYVNKRYAPKSIHTPKRIMTNRNLELDLSTIGNRHLVASGGSGGLGNPHFVTADIPGPNFASRGQPGEVVYLELELKTLADAGLVGLPNAGKSTFLQAVSNAHPKIAPYPFTTLNPYVGTIDFPDLQTFITIADIPGIIRGAHKNIGLGHTFLRHIERSPLLVYVVDLSSPAPWEDLDTLMNELELYKAGLTNRKSIVVANKADKGDVAKQNFPRLEKHVKELNNLRKAQFDDNDNDVFTMEIIPVSAKEKKNVTKVTWRMRELVEEMKMKEKENSIAS